MASIHSRSNRAYRSANRKVDFASEVDHLDRALKQISAALIPADQEPVRQQVLDFCRQNTDALRRSCLGGHLTASTFTVDLSSEAIALIHHRKLGIWLQPGGHADGEGNLLRVAATEVEEEVGLTDLRFVLPAFDLDIHPIPALGDDPEHLHLDLRFLAITSGTPSLNGNEETTAAGWVALDDDRMHDGDSVAGAARRALKLAAELTAT